MCLCVCWGKTTTLYYQDKLSMAVKHQLGDVKTDCPNLHFWCYTWGNIPPAPHAFWSCLFLKAFYYTKVEQCNEPTICAHCSGSPPVSLLSHLCLHHIALKTVCRRTGRRRGPWHWIQTPEIDPHLYGQLIFHKGDKIIQRGQNSLSNKWRWSNRISIWKKWTSALISPTQKSWLEVDPWPECKIQNYNVCRGKLRRKNF